MNDVRFILILCIVFFVLLGSFIELNRVDKSKSRYRQLVKCQGLASNVVSKLRTKGLKSNNLFFDKLRNEIVIQCMKLEEMR